MQLGGTRLSKSGNCTFRACVSRVCVVKQESLISPSVPLRRESCSHRAAQDPLRRAPSSRSARPGLRLPAAPARGGHRPGREGKGRPGLLGGPGGACVARPGRGSSAQPGSARPGSAGGCPAPCGAGGRCPAPRRRCRRCYAKARGGRILPGGTGGRQGWGLGGRGQPACGRELGSALGAGAAGGSCSLQKAPGGPGAHGSLLHLWTGLKEWGCFRSVRWVRLDSVAGVWCAGWEKRLG